MYLEAEDLIGIHYGKTLPIAGKYGGGSVDWSKVDATDLESVQANLPPCHARAMLEARLTIAAEVAALREALVERQDMMIQALTGVSGDDLPDLLEALGSHEQHLARANLPPNLMRYLNDIARSNRGIGVRMDHDMLISQAMREAIQNGGAVDYKGLSSAAAQVEPARRAICDEDSSYINRSG